MAEGSHRREGSPSPKRVRLSEEALHPTAKNLAASGDHRDDLPTSSKTSTPLSGVQGLPPTWLPPLLPSHTTALKTVPHPDAPPYGRHGVPPHMSVGHPKPANRASLANLINPDPSVGFSILQDRSASPAGPTRSPVPFKSPIRPSFVLPLPNPLPKDPGYVYHIPYADDGGVSVDLLAGLAPRPMTNPPGSRARRDQVPSRHHSGTSPPYHPGGQVPPPRDPEAYVSKDQAWFALGPRAEKASDSWSIDRIGGYNEGFTDAVNAVKSGMVGINGMRYARPVFWRPNDPQRSLAEADMLSSSSRPGYGQSSSYRMSTSTPHDPWPSQYGSHHPSDYGPEGEGKLSPETRSGKRLPISCYPCRKRKLKCDGNVPCGPCVKRDSVSECGYEKDVRRRGKGKKQMDEADWLVPGTGAIEGLGLTIGRDDSPRAEPSSSGGKGRTPGRPGTSFINSRPFNPNEGDEARRPLGVMGLTGDQSDESELRARESSKTPTTGHVESAPPGEPERQQNMSDGQVRRD